MFGKNKTPKDLSSEAVAYSDLFLTIGKPADVNKLDDFFLEQHKLAGDDPLVDFWSLITLFDPQLELTEVGHYGTWPNSNHSVLKFQYQDLEEPYLEVNGERIANIIDHYCLVANFGEKLILDSLDNEIKSYNLYGPPVSWASYRLKDPSVVEPVRKKNQDENDPRSFRVLEDTDAWKVASQLKQPAEDLIEHNELEDPHHIPAGTMLHLPYAREVAVKKPIRYEFLERPLKMHVSLEGGTRKQSFGNIQSLEEVTLTGPTFPQNSNVEIVAIAHVPVGENTATYYMDSISIADGKVKFTIGFNHTHLEEGHVEKPKPKPIVQVQVAMQQDKDQPAPGIAALPTTSLDLDDDGDNLWKTTYVPFEEPRKYVAKEAMWVQDLAGKRPDRMLHKVQDVIVAGTFIKNDVLYGRPTGAVKNFLWFGVPMDNLIPEDELYNTDIPLAAKVTEHLGHLTLQERGVVALSKVLSQGTRLRTWLKKQKT